MIQTEGDAVVLSYRYQPPVGDLQDIRERVHLDYTRCYFGGQRPWFVCPREGCGRRVAKLYAGRYFLCRECHGLAYGCQRESKSTRLMHKAQKIRIWLGGTPSLMTPFPEKPRGTHWSTYLRLQDRALRAEMTALNLTDDWIRKIA